MIEGAEKEGTLTPDKIMLEPTSGNTGISLAMIASIKGYKLKAVMPESVSVERREILKGFGAEIVLSPGEKGTNGAIELAKQIYERDKEKYFMPNQYENQNNPLAHYETTAVEILRDVPQVDVFLAGLGTSGTLMGVGKKLKEVNPCVEIVAVQPYPKSGLQGLRALADGYVPPILDMNVIDRSEFSRDTDAFKAVKDLALVEGLFAGISCGAVTEQAVKIANRLKSGNIVTVFPDAGWKYLSERIWSEEPEKLAKELEGSLW
jgi:cysteine synthase B